MGRITGTETDKGVVKETVTGTAAVMAAGVMHDQQQDNTKLKDLAD